MKTIFCPGNHRELQTRLATLQPDSPRQWGTMTVAQMLAHCSIGMQMTLDEIRPPRQPIGRILGPVIKRLALKDDTPIRRNTPTIEGMAITEPRDFAVERDRLRTLIDRFFTAGPSRCTTHPHAFFGSLTPDQWGILVYKHLDHHLRQFNA